MKQAVCKLRRNLSAFVGSLTIDATLLVGRRIVRSHNETLSVAAMRVHNPDRSPFGIHSCGTAPTPTGFTQEMLLRWLCSCTQED
jgi:hypothetical protein